MSQSTKRATATRTGPDSYDVDFHGSEKSQTGVPYAYVLSCVKQGGMTVDVQDNTPHPPQRGEMKNYRMEQE